MEEDIGTIAARAHRENLQGAAAHSRSPPTTVPSTPPATLPSVNMFGPLGASFGPQILASPRLSRWIKPIANWYVGVSGYRKVGLRYDDLRASFIKLP